MKSDLHSRGKASRLPRHWGLSPAAPSSALETGSSPFLSVAAASFCTISFQTNGFPFREFIRAQPRVGRAGFLPWVLLEDGAWAGLMAAGWSWRRVKGLISECGDLVPPWNCATLQTHICQAAGCVASSLIVVALVRLNALWGPEKGSLYSHLRALKLASPLQPCPLPSVSLTAARVTFGNLSWIDCAPP